jgi:hypothetical protein
MSRAEMFSAWWDNLISEMRWYVEDTYSFLVYYTSAGLELWGDNESLIFAGMALISWLYWFRKVWVSSEHTQANLHDGDWTESADPSVTSTYDRFMKSLFLGAYLGAITVIVGWPVLTLLLGFFFGPVRV